MLVICEYCGKGFNRSTGRYNEAIKMNWRQFCSPNCQANAKQKIIEIQCSYPVCNKLFSRKLSQIYLSDKLFCSKSCSAKYYAQKSHHEHIRVCSFQGCNNTVISKDTRKKYCSPECLKLYQKISSYTHNSVIEVIKHFYKQKGRIPLKYEMKYLYAPARKHFGAWNKAIEAAGYDPNPVMFAKHYLAKDGHKCDSMAEKIVDDWLYKNHIEHRVHVNYLWNNGMKCDFLIGETWLEIFGLEGELKRYDELKKEKLRLIKVYNLKLATLNLDDVYNSDQLNAKLSKFYR